MHNIHRCLTVYDFKSQNGYNTLDSFFSRSNFALFESVCKGLEHSHSFSIKETVVKINRTNLTSQ